jgi:hypothetical protein
LKVGPDTSSLIETLMAACLMFIWAADPFVRAFDLNETKDRLQKQLQRFNELPQDEPAGVTVVPDFSASGPKVGS